MSLVWESDNYFVGSLIIIEIIGLQSHAKVEFKVVLCNINNNLYTNY